MSTVTKKEIETTEEQTFTSHNEKTTMRAIDKVRAALKERVQEDLGEWAGDSAIGHGTFPAIMTRSTAIESLRKDLAREVTWPNGKGFVFNGFKGVNNMTNKELSKRVNHDSSLVHYLVWDDDEFHLLFGNQRECLDPDDLEEMGLW